ncbi:neuron navigator 3-like isoform X2 [Asterias rubens]|uniref:neuron navigator 3-like isoform X2 n=1 Tax=Asterias rubens TaxID=7604 RepID=UPI001455775F|nr:neuron navigator 3-like isoform X2 [Asterias rubens]
MCDNGIMDLKPSDFKSTGHYCIDDSSSISSGISDTIAEISTDDNITGSSVSCSSSQASCNLLSRDGIKRGRASSDDSRSPGSSARNSCESGKNLEIFGEGGIPIERGKSSPQRRTLEDVRRKNGENSPRRSALNKSILKDATTGQSSPKRNGSGKNGKGSKSDQSKSRKTKGEESKADKEQGKMSGYPERGTLASPPGRSGIQPPPPSWQRSLDRIQVRQQQAARQTDPSLSPSLPRSRTGGMKYENGTGTLDRKNGSRLSQRNTEEQLSPNGPDSRKAAAGRSQGMQSFGFRRPGGPAASTAAQAGAKTSISTSKSANFRYPGSNGKGGRMSGSLSGSESAPERGSIRMKDGQRQKAGQKISPTSPPGGNAKADVNANTDLRMNHKNQEKMGQLSPTGSETGKSKLGGSKSSLSSTPSIKQLFGRKPDSVKNTGNKSQDTIISNPHATLAKHGSSPPRHPPTSTQSQFSGPASRRASTNMASDLSLSKTPYSDSLRYSGYLSDTCSYAGARDSGLGSLHAGMVGPFARANMHPSSLSTLNRSESGSMESLDSNNSSSMSMTSRATSERYGLTSPSSNGPSPHHSSRGQADKLLSISLAGKDAEETAWLRANGYPSTVDGAPPLSPASSTASQPVGQFFAIPGMSNSPMVRSNSMSASAYTQPPFTTNPRMRNNSVSLDERQRAALSMGTFCREPDGELHGSALSLVSQGSSLYSMSEDKGIEIRRLKRELDREQERVGNLSNQLHTNVSPLSV